MQPGFKFLKTKQKPGSGYILNISVSTACTLFSIEVYVLQFMYKLVLNRDNLL